MKPRLKWLLILIFLSGTVHAKTNISVTVEPFEDQSTGCKHEKTKTDIGTEIQTQLATILAGYENLLVNKDGDKTPLYKVEGALTAFGQCGSKKDALKSKISIDIRMVQTKTGSLTLVYNAKASAWGKNMKSLTKAALTDIAYKIDQAISRDQNAVRVELEPAIMPRGTDSDYHVDLVRREDPIPAQ